MRRLAAAARSVALAAIATACSRSTSQSILAAPDPAAVFGAHIPDRLIAQIATDEGNVRCVIEPQRAPRAAALFVALARGGYPWRDPSGALQTRPLYRDLAFHRVVPHVMVQTGCARGDGTGYPGYRIPLEVRGDDATRLATPGALFFATYTPPPMRNDPAPPPPGHVVGSQFAVGLVSMAHLAGRTTVLGTCENLDVLDRISLRGPHNRGRLRQARVEDESAGP